MTDNEFLAGFAERWLAAWNSHDTEQVLALLDEDIRWDDRTFWPEVIEGKEGVRAYTEKIWVAMPDVQFDEIQRFFAPDARRGVVLFRQSGHGPARLNPEATFDSHGCDIFLASATVGPVRFVRGSVTERDGNRLLIGSLQDRGADRTVALLTAAGPPAGELR